MWYKKPNYKKPAPNSGRKKGVPNLKKTIDPITGEAGYLNQNNVFISVDEKKALVNEVRKANRKSKAMRELFDALPYKERGVATGATVGERRMILGKEVDFSITEKNASLQRFESRKEFVSYMRNLKRVNSKNYVADRARLYKRNYQKALTDPYEGLGLPYDQVSDILMKIRTMKPEEYLKMVASNEELEIFYVYDKNIPLQEKLNSIRSSLGLKHREIDYFWEGEEYD